jgi:hypothetical protein
MKTYYERNRERILAYYKGKGGKKRRDRYRMQTDEAMERLGGARCAICGCEELIFLTIDHADGNGHEHRKQLGGSSRRSSSKEIRRWILSATDAELAEWNLRVLCFNCNCALNNATEDEVCAAVAWEHLRITTGV